ncbi:1-aminocyclopropane-1-carboxylate synthase-like protein 1 [Stylophora pistillata]|uniref:1-aminocyclopropane-1-carboxylate synthase-like protein 1 n=1 Tax=Stylophora pistillata TaxID=50429 RepID=A0A2B4SJ20_STYPI|nr:1-aminocyclopropane-1-carboxylate synthase-like protein 1 [Stylophora pistillata]
MDVMNFDINTAEVFKISVMAQFEEKESGALLPEHTQYVCGEGLENFREAIADFLNDHMEPVEPILPENLIVSNGCTPLVDTLAFSLADEGEGLLIPCPFYGSFHLDLQSRSRVIPFPVELSSKVGPGETQPFQLTVTRLESALKKATEQGVKIRGLLLCNPNNPLGNIYSEELLQDCLDFAFRHSLHVIVDEIYMMCGYREGCSVTNVMSLKNIPDKEMVHVLWGFSKDFGISGFRCGVLHTLNKELFRVISSGYQRFHDIPAQTQASYTMDWYRISSELFELMMIPVSMLEWLDKTFFPTNKRGLRNAYQMACDALGEVGIPFLPGECGLFIWVDFRELLPTSSFEDEMHLLHCMTTHGVFIFPGSYFCCPEPGWFRIIFAMETDVLQLGLSRIQQTVREVRAGLASKLDERVALVQREENAGLVESEEVGESLEDLVRTLHQQIKNSDWLKENTAEKWMEDNPELAKAFRKQNAEK